MRRVLGSRLFLLSIVVVLVSFAAGIACADEPPQAWRETGSLPAAEATQAAAADERFVYAVSNRTVAQYDRRSGQRVATSSGAAQHLNSAFLWQGRLYCAHSNYPEQPELSQIKTLDLATMRLENLHDFGSFVGSLTWVVRGDDAWWCNFARYGADNAQTTLVRFDDSWREQGRWTYPREVLAAIGRHSLSGGVWRDELLNVTDHDHRVVYRMQLPAAGDVLQYVDQIPAPFAGQGIANDPLTGGLVGIERAGRRVVFARLAEPLTERGQHGPLRLRVLSYNIHHGEGLDRQLDLPRVARVIADVAPDLVALQEVDQRVDRTGQVDQPAELARLSGMRVIFGANLALQGGSYGNAVLARLPIRRHENHRLPSLDNGEQRGVLEVTLELPGEFGDVRLWATHLDARSADAERLASAAAINQLGGPNSQVPALLAGDLNAPPTSQVLQQFARVWTNATRQPLLTSPAAAPRRQIDYVLYAPASRWRVVEARVLDEPVASDHRPLLVVLDLLRSAEPSP